MVAGGWVCGSYKKSDLTDTNKKISPFKSGFVLKRRGWGWGWVKGGLQSVWPTNSTY
jgi:hypothetical protein